MATTRQDIEVRVLDKTRTALNNVRTRLNGINSGLLGVNRVAGLAVTALGAIGGANVIRGIVETSVRFEDLRTTLSSVTGGLNEGAEAFAFISEFSTKTQFGIEELTQTFIKLKASGIEPTEDLLTTFTDTAAVTTDQLGSLEAITDLLSRTVSGGLGLEELNRLADRGIPVFRILEERLGITRLEISEFGKTAEGANKLVEALLDGLDESFGGATQDRLNNTSTAFSNLQIAIKNAQDAVGQQGFTKALSITATEITKFIETNDEFIAKVGRGLTVAFVATKNAIILVGQNIDLLAKAMVAFIALKIGVGIGSLALAFGSSLAGGILLATRALRLLAVTASKNPIIAAAFAISVGIEAVTGAFSKLAEMVGVSESTLNSMGSEISDFAVDAAGDFGEVITEVGNLFDGITGLGDAIEADMAEIDAALNSTKQETDALTESTDNYNEAAGKVGDKVTANTKKFKFYTDGIVRQAKVIEANNNLIAETPTLLEAYGQGIQEAFMTGERAVAAFGALGNKTFNTLSDEITKFVMTGKFNFRDFANSIIADLVRIAVQAAITFAIKTAAAAFGIPFFAEGGNIPRNQPAIVGEKGPELFIPKTAGTILSNEDSQGALTPAGGGGVTVNFNIVANDTRGFDELLLSRRGTIQGIINGALNQKGRVGVV